MGEEVCYFANLTSVYNDNVKSYPYSVNYDLVKFNPYSVNFDL